MGSNSLPPITLDSAACPYCSEVQDPPPQRRRKCRDCGKVIHTRTDYEARKRYLLTEREARALERERRDARWKELSQQVRVASQAGDMQALRLAYSQQAAILFIEGRNHLELQRLAARVELQHMQSIGIERVSVNTVSDERVCAHCRSLDGKVIGIEDALVQMPIPGPSCDDNRYGNPHGGWCRCIISSDIGFSVERRSAAGLSDPGTLSPSQPDAAQALAALIALTIGTILVVLSL